MRLNRAEPNPVNNAPSQFNRLELGDEASSPLALLHPCGVVQHSLVIGNNCPAVLAPNQHSMPSKEGDSYDLVIVAPQATELAQPRWLETVIESLRQRLAADGVAYLLLPPRRRNAALHLLRQCGLVLDVAFLHVPNRESSRHLVPLRPGALRYAFSQLITLPSVKRQVINTLLRLPGSHRAARQLLPDVGLVVRQASAPPLFQWWPGLEEDTRSQDGVVLTLSWRGKQGGVTCHHVAATGQPTAVAKIALSASATSARAADYANLTHLGATARATGVAIPRPLQVLELAGQPVFFQSVLEGAPAVTRLMASRHMLLRLLKPLAEWLTQWHLATCISQPLTVGLLQQWLLLPAAQLAPRWTGGAAYQQWLEEHFAPLLGTPIPLVATHNDLTMWNVLADDEIHLGIVDWETAQPHGLPLLDFFYAVTDAVAATNGYSSRLAAVQACFGQEGRHAGQVAAWQQRLQVALGLSAEVVTFCFHACWLHHAYNEDTVRNTNASKTIDAAMSEPKPFLEVVKWLASHPPVLAQPSVQ